MNLHKIITEGGEIPKWYGVSWRNCESLTVTCYPIPLNIMARVVKHFYYFLLRGCFRSRYEGELLSARLKGYRDAMKEMEQLAGEVGE